MQFRLELRRRVFLLLVSALLVEGIYAHSSVVTMSNDDGQVGRVLSVRKMLGNQPYRSDRYLQTHYYEILFSVLISDQTYCAQFTTPVLDDIDDLFSTSGKDVKVALKKSGLTATTLKGHKIKAHLVIAKQCLTPRTQAQGTLAPPEESSRLPAETPRAPQATALERTGRTSSSEPSQPKVGQAIRDPLITDYMNRLAQRLLAHTGAQLATTVEVVNSKKINAFVLPGWHFYVNSGLILATDSEAELAGILAHEIAHLTERHDARIQRRRRIWRIASLCSGPVGLPVQIAGFLSSMKLHREAELEADRLGLEYEYEAGYDPEAFVQFLQKVKATDQPRQSVVAGPFETHPPAEERIRRAQKEISMFLSSRSEYIIDTSEFQQVKLRLAGHGQAGKQ